LPFTFCPKTTLTTTLGKLVGFMKQLLLSLVLVAASLGARAQEYYLNLSRQRLEVPGRTVAVERVLDGRRGNLPLGYVY
jgi:hypothetical protein